MNVTTGRPRSNRATDPVAEWDRDAEGQTEARVINVSPHVARFEIATNPGTKARRYTLKPGETVLLQSGYTRDFTGAGRQPVRATIESLTEREVFPKGPRLPMVVHEDRATEVHDQWRAALEAATQAPDLVKVAIPSADGGEPIETLVRPPSIAPSAAAVDKLAAAMPVIEDEEDQAGELDEPPPDHDEPLPVVTEPKKGRK